MPPMFVVMFVIMAIYYLIAIFYSHRTYKHYKMLFVEQIGAEYF